MKKYLLTIMVILIMHGYSMACTVCKKQQPNILSEISHGAGPDSNWDFLIVLTAVAAVAGTFIYSVRYLLKPGETSISHIKHSILNPNFYE